MKQIANEFLRAAEESHQDGMEFSTWLFLLFWAETVGDENGN
jgi:hypothetical protein